MASIRCILGVVLECSFGTSPHTEATTAWAVDGMYPYLLGLASQSPLHERQRRAGVPKCCPGNQEYLVKCEDPVSPLSKRMILKEIDLGGRIHHPP